MTQDHSLTSRGMARLDALTETAGRLFLDQGYEAVSLDALIGEVGGSRRNIYQRFGGKQGLFVEVVTKLCNEQAEPLRQLRIGEGHDIDVALTVFAEKILEIVLMPRTLSLHRLMIAEGQRFPELAQAILRSGHETGVAILADWLRARPDELRTDICAETLAEQFVTLLVTGPQLRALVGDAGGRFDAAARSRLAAQTVAVFLRGAQPAERIRHA